MSIQMRFRPLLSSIVPVTSAWQCGAISSEIAPPMHESVDHRASRPLVVVPLAFPLKTRSLSSYLCTRGGRIPLVTFLAGFIDQQCSSSARRVLCDACYLAIVLPYFGLASSPSIVYFSTRPEKGSVCWRPCTVKVYACRSSPR